MQVSGDVHGSLSLQLAPLAAFVCAEQPPVAGSQLPAILHMPEVGQTTGLLPVQVPFWQVSVWVHMLPSLHGVPFATPTQLPLPPAAPPPIPPPLCPAAPPPAPLVPAALLPAAPLVPAALLPAAPLVPAALLPAAPLVPAALLPAAPPPLPAEPSVDPSG
jgi:hypothetical protein